MGGTRVSEKRGFVRQPTDPRFQCTERRSITESEGERGGCGGGTYALDDVEHLDRARALRLEVEGVCLLEEVERRVGLGRRREVLGVRRNGPFGRGCVSRQRREGEGGGR